MRKFIIFPLLTLGVILLLNNLCCYWRLPWGFPWIAYKEVVVKSVPFTPGDTLSLDTRNGWIEVNSWDKEEAKIEATKQAYAPSEKSAAKLFEQTKVNISAGKHKIIIETEIPKIKTILVSYNNVGVSYRILVPKEANLILRTSDGKIEVSHIDGNIKAKTSYGNMKMGDINGNIETENHDGNICIEKMMGYVKVKTNYGKIEMRDIEGSIEAKNHDGSIYLENIKGNTIRGETAYGDVQMSQISGNIEAKSHDGDIYIESVKGNNIEGQTSYGKIKCEIDTLIESSNISLRNHDGGIELYIPEVPQPSIYAKAQNGIIDADFPIYVKRSALKGKVIVTLETSYGNIYIRKK